MLLAVVQQAGVKGQVVGGGVRDQCAAAAVGDNAAGGLHPLFTGDGVDGLRQIIRMVNHLRVHQNTQVGQQNRRQKPRQNQQAGSGGFMIHGISFADQSFSWALRWTARNSTVTGMTSGAVMRNSRAMTEKPAPHAAFRSIQSRKHRKVSVRKRRRQPRSESR